MLYQLSYLPNPDVRAVARIRHRPGERLREIFEAKNEGYGTEIASGCQAELAPEARQSFSKGMSNDIGPCDLVVQALLSAGECNHQKSEAEKQ